MNTIPLTFYVHFPWCLSKCPYCDFNSYALKDPKTFEAYIDALLVDLANEAATLDIRQLVSIYFGGGTPSLLSPNNIEKIIDFASRRFNFAPNIEITIEANPGALPFDLSQYKSIGINRISLGVQSFDDQKLRLIGRIHDAITAVKTIDAIKNAGFSNFNLDFIYGLPTQNVHEALSDLEHALSFKPPHISWYQLTIEPNTDFGVSKPEKLPQEEELWDIQEAGRALLASSGYTQYEVAAFSKDKEHTCIHNVNYWQYGDYIGIGAGAHSKITGHNHKVKRYSKNSLPKTYIKNPMQHAYSEEILLSKLGLDFMLNALRLYSPIPFDLLKERTGISTSQIGKQLTKAKELGLIEVGHDSIITTTQGKNFLNNLLEIFCSE